MTKSRYRWVIVAAGGLLGCVAIGAMFSLPVLLQPIAKDTGWSVTGVSSAMTIGFLAMALGSIAWGSLSDRVGPRAVVLSGAIVLAASVALASQATSLLGFQLIFGLLVGGSAAAIIVPMMACVTGWFDTHRSLAVSLVSAGMGMAPMTMAPLAAWLVSSFSWRTTLEILAAIAALLMIPAALLVRRPPALVSASPVPDGALQSGHVGWRCVAVSAIHRARAHQFLLLRNPFRADLSYRELRANLRNSPRGCGLDLQRRGRSGHGRPDRLRVAWRSLRRKAHSRPWPACAGVRGARLRVRPRFGGVLHSRGDFRLHLRGRHAALCGARARKLPLRMMGTVIGGTAMAGSLGMALGPLAGGLIYDTFASYTWLYVGSWAMGIGAFLIAMTFRPLPKEEPALAAAPA